jgi:hypothetical protein
MGSRNQVHTGEEPEGFDAYFLWAVLPGALTNWFALAFWVSLVLSSRDSQMIEGLMGLYFLCPGTFVAGVLTALPGGRLGYRWRPRHADARLYAALGGLLSSLLICGPLWIWFMSR